ncbi:MAG: hypothetical protein AAF565_13540, partial [Pseudomonadota bacterium]
ISPAISPAISLARRGQARPDPRPRYQPRYQPRGARTRIEQPGDAALYGRDPARKRLGEAGEVPVGLDTHGNERALQGHERAQGVLGGRAAKRRAMCHRLGYRLGDGTRVEPVGLGAPALEAGKGSDIGACRQRAGRPASEKATRSVAS